MHSHFFSRSHALRGNAYVTGHWKARYYGGDRICVPAVHGVNYGKHGFYYFFEALVSVPTGTVGTRERVRDFWATITQDFL